MDNYPDPGQSARQAYQPMQSGYPPAQPGYPLAPAIQRSRVELWAALAVLLLVLGVGGGAFYYFQLRSTPEKTLQAYCDAITTDNARELYDTYSRSAQVRTSVNGLQQVLQILTLLTGGVKACSVDSGSIQENDSTASGAVIFTSSSDRSARMVLHLIEEDGRWKIESNESMP